MASLTSWNQLQIVTPEPLAGGGEALNNNFKNLSTHMDSVDPGAANDSTEGYALGSIWYNTSTNTGFICVDATVASAVWNPMPTDISFTNTATSGTVTALTIKPIYNQTSGTAANTDLFINRTETHLGSGAQNLIDAQVGSTSMFKVDHTGAVSAGNITSSGAVTAATFSGSAASLTSLPVTQVTGKTYSIAVDALGQTIGTGTKGYFRITANATIVSWTLVADVSTSTTIYVNKVNLSSSFGSGTAIYGTAPSLSSTTSNSSSSLSGWTTALSVGDLLEIVVNANTLATKLYFTLETN